MKKTKAKPVKGSARAKKFDAGGLAALAGLGALAYMMRKKKGESEGSAPKDKSGYSSGPVDVGRMIEGRGDEEPSAEVKRAMAASKGRPDLIPEGATDADKATMYGDTVAKRVMPKPKPKSPTSQTFPLTKPTKSATEGFGKVTQLGEDSDQAKAMRESRKQRLGATYAKQYSAYQNAPAGADKEALRKSMEQAKRDYEGAPLKKGGAVKASKMGAVKQAKPSMGSASKRADGIAQRGKTRGRVL
jgi:hypothetical protein